MSSADTKTLTDDVLRFPDQIGPMEVRVQANWERVDRALQGLLHGPVVYRWRLDSTGEPALFIEVTVPADVDSDQLLVYRDAIHEAVDELDGQHSVYVHFIGPDDAEGTSG